MTYLRGKEEREVEPLAQARPTSSDAPSLSSETAPRTQRRRSHRSRAMTGDGVTHSRRLKGFLQPGSCNDSIKELKITRKRTSEENTNIQKTHQRQKVKNKAGNPAKHESLNSCNHAIKCRVLMNVSLSYLFNVFDQLPENSDCVQCRSCSCCVALRAFTRTFSESVQQHQTVASHWFMKKVIQFQKCKTFGSLYPY